jgi:hypothetical protein
MCLNCKANATFVETYADLPVQTSLQLIRHNMVKHDSRVWLDCIENESQNVKRLNISSTKRSVDHM